MILDTSAISAIFFEEPDGDLYLRKLYEAKHRRISAANFVELAIVIERQLGAQGSRQCDMFFRRAEIVIEPVTIEQAHLARQAFLDFGKGRHPAGLNFGDCFAYALAKAAGEPLLYKGMDFSKTDVQAAA
jgi:ribonuclease VapC